MNFPKIDPSWTLFLDRDGVLNRKIENGYVLDPSMLEILPGVTEAIRNLSNIFGRIIVVTNQRGIGRGMMTEKDLQSIHAVLLEKVKEDGGRIDGIFYCPHNIEGNCDCRKPKPGLALKAKQIFPEINFAKSIMVGDSDSDIEMGKLLGMVTVKISQDGSRGNSKSDFLFEDLIGFAKNKL